MKNRIFHTAICASTKLPDFGKDMVINMYRLSNIQDYKLQAIITKEIMNGFEDVFQLHSKDADVIANCIEEFCEDNDIPMETRLEQDLLIYKIIGMYQELADTNYQYTFDEQGEWILYRLLMQKLSSYEEFLEYAENETDAYQDEEPTIDDFWESSLSKDDIAYVENFADLYFKELINELNAEDDINENIVSEFAESKQMFIDRVTYFPLMAFEITDDVTPEFLFWDRDFLLIDHWGQKEFEEKKDTLAEHKDKLGFSSVNEYTQLYTGSERFDME